MQRYEFVLALANFQVVSRNETGTIAPVRKTLNVVGADAVLVFYVLAIAKGIYLSLQNRGYTGDVCFFDNFSFEEILPPLKYRFASFVFCLFIFHFYEFL